MGCNNCRDKQSQRHKLPETSGKGFVADKPLSVAEQKIAQPKNIYVPQEDPITAFVEAQQLSYEELSSRNKMRLAQAQQVAEAAVNEMTDDMKRIYVEMLVSVANGDLMAMGNLTPEQAVIGLKQLVERPDFEFIRNLYPNLKVQVNIRHADIMQKRIILE